MGKSEDSRGEMEESTESPETEDRPENPESRTGQQAGGTGRVGSREKSRSGTTAPRRESEVTRVPAAGGEAQPRRCPFCREEIRPGALKCPHCAEFLDNEVAQLAENHRAPLPEGMKLSVVIPVYNERSTVEQLIERVKAVPLEKEIIVVDDCSSDGTRDVLEKIDEPGVRIFFHEENRGKGAALKTGFDGVEGDIVVIQDADLEYDPQEYFRLIRPILEGKADVVYGSRFLGGHHRVLFFWHYLGNKFLTLLSNMFTNLNLTDMETCYKVFRAQLLDGLEIRSRRFGVEPELTAKFARRRCRIFEVPISYSGRDYSEGKKIGWKDGVSAIWNILKFRFFD